MDFLRFLGRVFLSIANVVVTLIEGLMWLSFGTKRAVETTADAVHLVRVTAAGMLTCPRGHEIPIIGTFACSACGFTYEGNRFYCPNPECPAPVSSRAECLTCGLSVRNPRRIGGR